MSGTLSDLKKILYDLNDTVSEQIQGSLIASKDGLLVTDTLGNSEDAERISAMVATTIGVSQRMASALRAGVLNETSIAAADRRIQLYLIGDKGILAVVTNPEVNVALVNLSARKAVKKAEGLLQRIITA